MYFLGIDPGNIESAYCLINGKEEIIAFGKIENDMLLSKLENDINYQDHFVAIESVNGFGRKVGQTVFDTCVWIGRFYQVLKYKIENDVILVARKTVVSHHCGSSNGGDKDVREAMIYRYGERGTKKSKGETYGISKDCWSALAIATWLKDKHEVKNERV